MQSTNKHKIHTKNLLSLLILLNLW